MMLGPRGESIELVEVEDALYFRSITAKDMMSVVSVFHAPSKGCRFLLGLAA